jgi:uncharacterized membrane protein YbhN (UPF0104 family)
VLSAVVGLVIVAGVFVYAIPKFADYSQIWAAMKTLTPLEFWSLFAATVFNLFTYWLANQAALPGIKLSRAAVLTQTTTTVANTLPAGGAIAVGLTYSILNSWGFLGTDVALYVGVTGIWNIFTKLALPVIALLLLVVTGEFRPALLTATVVGVVALIVAVVLLAMVFRSEPLARKVGDFFGRVVGWFRRLFRRPSETHLGDSAVRFRRDTIGLVERRWFRLTWTTVLSQLALCFVLILSLRSMGISEQEISTVEIFAVFSFSRLLSAVPLTPGGVGVIDLGYVAGLTGFYNGQKPEVVAAVLIFRALTYGIQIPIGIFTYWIWQAKKSWRRDVRDKGVELTEQTSAG